MPHFDYDTNGPILMVLMAAAQLDRENLDAVEIHADRATDDERRRELEGSARVLSNALAALPPGLVTALLVESGGGALCYEIIGSKTGKVIGVTQNPLSVLAEEPDATFNRIPVRRFRAYPDNPWSEPSSGSPPEDPAARRST